MAGEIRISLTDGSALHVLDLFVVNHGLIDSLNYFISDHPWCPLQEATITGSPGEL